jgi:hypothetical protein
MALLAEEVAGRSEPHRAAHRAEVVGARDLENRRLLQQVGESLDRLDGCVLTAYHGEDRASDARELFRGQTAPIGPSQEGHQCLLVMTRSLSGAHEDLGKWVADRVPWIATLESVGESSGRKSRKDVRADSPNR